MPFISTKPTADVETLFINNLAKTRIYGYLPPHGKSLAAGASKTFPGDIRSRMLNREVARLQLDIDRGDCSIYVYQRQLLALPAATTPAIAIGDAIIWVAGNSNCEPAASTVWNTNLATTQADFTNIFMGIAVSAKAGATAGKLVQVDISPNSFREVPCTSETHDVVEYISMAKDTGNNLLSGTYVKAVAASSPFRIRRKDTAAATKVLVSWQSAYYGFNAQGSQ
jgi:hypothetical protein